MDTIRPFAQGSYPLPEFDRPGVFTSTDPSGEPIRVARKIRGKKRPNVFLDDQGFPDQSHEFDVILHNIEGGPILWKRKHAAPPLDDIDPRFLSQYDEKIHGKKLRKEIDLSHLDGTTRDLVYKLLQKYWSVFDEAAAAANATLHADVVAEIEAIEAHIYKKCAFVSCEKEPGDIPGSILMSPKRARVADVSDNSTTDGTASVATIGSVIDPFGNLITEGDMPSFDKMDSA